MVVNINSITTTVETTSVTIYPVLSSVLLFVSIFYTVMILSIKGDTAFQVVSCNIPVDIEDIRSLVVLRKTQRRDVLVDLVKNLERNVDCTLKCGLKNARKW